MFGPLVVAYLFLGGTGAGACCVLSGMALLVPAHAAEGAGALGACRAPARRRVFDPSRTYRRLFAPAFAAACATVALGMCMLLADAGTTLAPVLLAANPTATLLSFGSFALALSAVLSGGLAFAWASRHARLRLGFVRAAHAATLVVGCAVAAYTGLLLASMPAVPAWHTPWLPALFVASSLSCGCALVVACSCATGVASAFRSVARRLAAADVAMIAAEALFAAGFLAAALSCGYDVAAQGATSLLTGRLWPAFVVAFLGVGLLVPGVLESALALRRAHAPGLLLASSAAVLAGGVALRYCIVAIGAHPEVWTVVS